MKYLNIIFLFAVAEIYGFQPAHESDKNPSSIMHSELPKTSSSQSVLLDRESFCTLYTYCIDRKEQSFWFGTSTVVDSYLCRMSIDIRKVIWKYVTYQMCQHMILKHGALHCLLDVCNAYQPHPFDYHIPYLISTGRNSIYDSDYPCGPLYWASLLNNTYKIEKLLKLELNVNGHKNITPLHCAAWFGKIPAATMLIKHGADVNAVSLIGRTPLHYAVFSGKMDMVTLLLAHGANPHKTDSIYSYSPLDYAQNYPRIKEVFQTAGVKQKSECVIV